MTYEQIAEWVKSNFNLDEYFDPEELVREVKRTFEREQAYFPNEAIKYIREAWKENITEIPQEGLDYYNTAPQRETLEDVRADYRNRFANFFEAQNPVPEYHDVEETLATPPPVIEQLPPVDVTPERQTWFTGGFRSLGKRVWKLLGL